MRAKISGVLAVCLILGILPLAMLGQQPGQQYQLFLVIDEVVRPSMAQKYFEASKKYVAFIKDHDYPFPFNTYWTSDNHVYWSIPIENYAQIDKIMAQSNKFFEKFPDAYKALMEAFKGTYESTRLSVYALDLEYSIIAEEETMESGENNFVFFDSYYFEPGTEAELNKLLGEWKSFVADKKIVQSWGFYWGMMGTENPVLVMASTAKNQIDFWEKNGKMWENLGKEAETYIQKMMKYVRKQEQKTAWMQKELSYAPAEK